MTTTTSPAVLARPRALAGVRSAGAIVASIVLVGSPGARAAEEERFTGVARGRDGRVGVCDRGPACGGQQAEDRDQEDRSRRGRPRAPAHPNSPPR